MIELRLLSCWPETILHFFSCVADLCPLQTYPLMPPRLVPSCDEYGGCLSKEYTFVDTMDVYGGLWSWKDKAVTDLSNHYAAMPSMHTGYAAWTCVSVFTTAAEHKWLKVLAVLHPVFTVYCIVVTANHYIVDAIAGAMCFLIAHKLAAWMPKYGRGASWTSVEWPTSRGANRSSTGENTPGWYVRQAQSKISGLGHMSNGMANSPP